MRGWHPGLAVPVFLAAACSGATDVPTNVLPATEEVTMRFCAAQTPIILAYRNQGREWQRVTKVAFQNSFTFPATDKLTLLLARGSAFGSSSEIRVLNLTRAEAAAFTCPNPAGGNRLMLGSVRPLAPSDAITIGMGPRLEQLLPGTTTFAILGLRTGKADLVARLRPQDVTRDDLIILRHDIDVVEGATMPELDFSASEARPLARTTFSFAGLPAEVTVNASLELHTANGTFLPIGQNLGNGSGTAVRSVSTAQLAATDLHRVDLVALEGNDQRRVIFYTNALRDSTITLGGRIANLVIDTVAAASQLRPRARLDRQAAYGGLAEIVYFQIPSAGGARSVSVMTTAAYAGNVTRWELEVPDLATIPEFPQWWALEASRTTSAIALTFDTGLAAYFGTRLPALGDRISLAVKTLP